MMMMKKTIVSLFKDIVKPYDAFKVMKQLNKRHMKK